MTLTEPISPYQISPSSEELMPLRIESLPYEPVVLEPHKPKVIQTGATIYDPKDVENAIGFKANVCAEVTAADKRLMVVDLRGYKKGENGYRDIQIWGEEVQLAADFLLVSPEDINKEFTTGFLGIRNGSTTEFGRNEKCANRFSLTSEVSRKHFIIYPDGNGSDLIIEDVGSTFGTEMVTADHTVVSNRTSQARSHLQQTHEIEPPSVKAPYGSYEGDPIIGRDSPRIAGGVYIGTGREAITVKPDEDPRISEVFKMLSARDGFRKLFSRFAVKEGSNGPEGNVQQQLQSVLKVVESVMDYDEDKVEQLSKNYYGHQKVSLGEYIQQGIGVCRHQGLLAALLVEKLIDGGVLGGTVRMERNTIKEFGGTHAWATYTDTDGEEYVIDPAQDYMGTKSNARINNAGSWDYYLSLR